MNSIPRISVIVPVYNVEAYLERCVKSVLVQTFSDFELILVDDGSPDNCYEMCDEFAEKDSRICVIHQENQGLSSARNSGIRIARGDYITFIDSDDWVRSSFLEDLLQALTQYNADIAVCNFQKISDQSADTCSLFDNSNVMVYSRDDFMNVILKINSNRTIHYAWGKLYKKQVLDSDHFPVGMLNEDVEGTFKAVMRSERIVETSAKDYFYFVNENSITRKKFGNNFLNLTDVWKRVLDISLNQAPQYKEKVEYNLIRMDFTILTDSILYGDRKTDQEYSMEIRELRKRLRSNIRKILAGPMVTKRKILVVIICFFYIPLRLAFRLKNRGRK